MHEEQDIDGYTGQELYQGRPSQRLANDTEGDCYVNEENSVEYVAENFHQHEL